MQIEVHGETEQMIQQQIDSGRFDSPEAVVEAAMEFWSSSGTNISMLSKRIDVEAFLEQQGVQPVRSDEDLLGPGGPPDETADEMIEGIRSLRKSSPVEPRL